MEAFEWRRLAWLDENGQVSGDAFDQAIKQRDEYLEQQSAPDGFSDGGVDRLSWVSRGPQNIGGRTRAIVIHPGNRDIIWAGSASGGIWKSFNGGQTWMALNNTLQNLSISCLTIDPNNPNTLYAGTGEVFRGAGIFKTTDGGMTWRQLPGTRPNAPPDDFNWSSVGRITIAHDNSNIILAGTKGGIMRSTTAGEGDANSWSRVVGIYESLYLAFDPTNSNNAIAEIRDNVGGWHHRVIYSTDRGLTWTNSTRDGSIFRTNDERIELAYMGTNGNIVYAMHRNSDLNSETKAFVSRSFDGGRTFTTRASRRIPNPVQGPNSPIAPSGWNNTIWVSPTNSDFVIAGGTTLHKSINGGDDFHQIATGHIVTGVHVDFHAIVPDPGFNGNDNRRVYVGNDGGVFRTNDITTANTQGDSPEAGWERLNQTYQTTQFYAASGSKMGTSELIIGGTQDNGSLRLLDNNTNATNPCCGDGGFSAVDPTNHNYVYSEDVYLQIHRSTNGGGSMEPIYSGITDVFNFANFVAPFILDPNDPNRILAGGRSLWRTNNARGPGQPSWTAIRPHGSANISAVAVAQGNPSLIWIAQSDGKVFKTNNGLAANPTWITIDDNIDPPNGQNPLPNRFPTRIVVDKDNHNVVYVSFGGFNNGNLQRTTNGGTSWQDITGAGLPNVPIRGIARHPNNANALYVGTEIGVYTSLNGGESWLVVLDGPANVSVDEVVFMSNSTTLIAATHGRGIWTTNIDNPGSANRVLFDFDGDGRSDPSVFRPSNATWYLQRSQAGFQSVNWGLEGDKTPAADFDGDGKTDITVWRVSTGNWHRINSSNGTFYSFNLGQNGDIPVPADFDGDGKADEAVFRPSTGAWYLNRSTLGFAAYQWGAPGDIPVAADFDGDGKADLGVFRQSNGLWCLINSATGVQYLQFGQNEDIPVAADYDGDAKADPAVFRNGTWHISRSLAGYLAVQWGLSTDKPVPGDYDGDGKTDVAVWRPSNGTWYLLQSTNGFRSVQFGAITDVPIPK